MAEDEASERGEAGTSQAPPGMVQIPAGTFRYGRGRGREVELGEFWIDPYLVTNKDYLDYSVEFRRPAPRHWPPQGLAEEHYRYPVVNLTVAEAEAFAEAYGKRLPTPAQLEKAARGQDGRKYPWGDSVQTRVTNTRESGIGDLTPVDAYPEGASPYGCYDLCGNALHWTRGVYDSASGSRVLKGGCYREFLGACSWTYEGDPDQRYPHVGFRCVWMPLP